MRKLGRLLIPLLVLTIAIGSCGCGGGGGAAAPAPVTSARASALETDLITVKAAVDAYAIQSGAVPAVDGKLPLTGEYALIDFFASFTQGATTLSFYPDFIFELPRHHDEGVWRIDSAMQVSIAIAPANY